MGSRSVDCCVLHTIPALLGAFLALTTPIAGQQDNAASRSLPDIKQLLNDLQENQKQIDRLVDQYSCTETDKEVWLPSYVEAHFSARLLLFASALGDYTSRFSDYKKFRVESVIVTLKKK
jgi:hypothetical protein